MGVAGISALRGAGCRGRRSALALPRPHRCRHLKPSSSLLGSGHTNPGQWPRPPGSKDHGSTLGFLPAPRKASSTPESSRGWSGDRLQAQFHMKRQRRGRGRALSVPRGEQRRQNLTESGQPAPPFPLEGNRLRVPKPQSESRLSGGLCAGVGPTQAWTFRLPLPSQTLTRRSSGQL